MHIGRTWLTSALKPHGLHVVSFKGNQGCSLQNIREMDSKQTKTTCPRDKTSEGTPHSPTSMARNFLDLLRQAHDGHHQYPSLLYGKFLQRERDSKLVC